MQHARWMRHAACKVDEAGRTAQPVLDLACCVRGQLAAGASARHMQGLADLGAAARDGPVAGAGFYAALFHRPAEGGPSLFEDIVRALRVAEAAAAEVARPLLYQPYLPLKTRGRWKYRKAHLHTWCD